MAFATCGADLSANKLSVIAFCDLPKVGPELVGKVVAIVGTVQQGVEAAQLEDTSCRIAVAVQLQSVPDGPSLFSCLNRASDRRCGGVRRNGQRAIVVGTLISAPKAVEIPGKGTLWTSAYMKVLQFKAASGGKVKHGA